MRTAVAIAVLLGSAGAGLAQYNPNGSYGSTYGNSGLYGTGSNPNSHNVSPYVNSHGTYVGGHYQTNPNSTQLDNYGTRGNHNPYTGTYGTRIPHH